MSPQVHNPYDQHFGPNPEILTEHRRRVVDAKQWESYREKIGKLGTVASVPSEASLLPQKNRAKKTAVRPYSCTLQYMSYSSLQVLERLLNPFEARQIKQPAGALAPLPSHTYSYFNAEHTQIQDDLLSVLSAYLDVYHTSVTLEHHRCIREVIALHALDHVTK